MMSQSSFNISSVREKFPALAQDQVFLDNAGGSQVLGSVIDSIRDYLTKTNVQLGATYAVGKKSTEQYSAGYQAAATYVNCSAAEIVMGASTTQLFRNLSYTLHFDAGDELIISGIDHEANIASWVDLADRQQLVIKWWTPKSKTNPRLVPEDLDGLLSDKTRLVTCTHASNILGTIHDIKAIAHAVHKYPRAMLCVDAVAYAPHRSVDVRALGVDFYGFSWYKVYGPHMSILYASEKAQTAMKSLGHYFNRHNTLEDKIGLAGSSYELVQSLPHVVDYLGAPDSQKWKGILEQEEQLQSTLLQYLNSRLDVTIIGEPSADPLLRVATVSFVVKGWNSRELVETVEKDTTFGFRWGTFYSNRLVRDFLDLESDGVVRVSMVHYNTVEEVKAFISALDATLAREKQ